jgi:hypothetical protein
MTSWKRAIFCSAAACIFAFAYSGAASAGIHTWDVNEVFSNADGTIQFVEMFESGGGAGETGMGTGTLSSNTQSFGLTGGPVPVPTSNKFYLIATQGFADLPGAPVPDEIIPAGSVVFFDTAGDTVSFGAIDSWAFGAVPTNGTDSLDRFLGVGANSPTNYLGTTGSVDASGAPGVPALASPALIALAGLLVLGSVWAAVRTRSRIS